MIQGNMSKVSNMEAASKLIEMTLEQKLGDKVPNLRICSDKKFEAFCECLQLIVKLAKQTRNFPRENAKRIPGEYLRGWYEYIEDLRFEYIWFAGGNKDCELPSTFGEPPSGIWQSFKYIWERKRLLKRLLTRIQRADLIY